MEVRTGTVEPTENAPIRPTELSRVWIQNKIIAHDVEGDDLADVLQQNGDASAWAVLPCTDSVALRRMARFLDLDELVITQLLDGDQQIRYDDVGRTRVAMLRTAQFDPESAVLVQSQVSLIIADQLLLAVADEPVGHQIAQTLSQAAERLADGGPDRAVQLVIRQLVSGYATTVEALETAADDLADDMFAGDPLPRNRKLEVFQLRRTVTQLRRVTEPAREVVQNLAESGDSGGVDGRRWDTLAGRHERVANAVDNLGDSLTMIFETSLSVDGAHTNEVMKKLTGWAAIVAIPALITGFVGMNVDFWFHGSAAGFYLYLALMVVSAVLLYVVFKRKTWI